MTILIGVLGIIVYSLGCLISYNEPIRNSHWLFIYGLGISNMAALLWLWLVRHLNNTQQIYIAGILWDVMIGVVYTVIPLLLFNLKLTNSTIVALIMMVGAILLMKLGP